MAVFTAIGTAISAVGAWIGTLGAIGSFLLKTAVGIGLNLLAQAIAGKPKDPTFSINGTLQAGGDIPRSFILGRTATAGSLVWVNTWGKSGDTPNAYLTQVIALSDLLIASLDEIWVNGEKVTLGSTPHAQYGYPVNEYRKSGKDHLWIKFHDGTQTTADALLTGSASNSQRQWQSTRVGRGVAYVIVTSLVRRNMFSGIPNFKFAVSGLKLYDPSKDSTVPGGSGSHRWAEPETWGGDGDHNPAVQIYNLLRGIRYNGEWFYGLQGVTATRLPSADWITQINKCRAGDIYRSGGEIPVEAPLAPAIEGLLTACQGRVSEIGGVYKIFVGEPDDPVASFLDGEILSTEEQSFTPFFGLADTINGIAATYPSPEDGWAEKAAPPLYRTDLEVLAGNRRLMADVALNFVPYPEQVQRLMKSALAEGQRARRHTLVLPPSFWPYAVPGAIVSWTSARNGYVDKLFRVDGAVDRANLDVMIDITEVDPADFDWDSETDFEVPVDGAVGNMRPEPQPIVDWSASADSVKDDDGNPRRPAIRLAWDNTEGRLDDVMGIEVEVRLSSTHETVYGGRTEQPEVGALLISQGLLPLTQYEVRGRYIPEGDRETLWSGWLVVTTLDIRITDIEARLSTVGADVYQTLQMLRAEADILREDIRALAAAQAEMATRVATNNSVAVRFQDATAVAMQVMMAAIRDEEGNIVSVAEILQVVQAAVGSISAEGLRKVEVQAGTGDVIARLVDMVRATVGDEWVEAGTIVEVGFEDADPAKPFAHYLIAASRFVVYDPNTGERSKPLVFDDGVLHAPELRVEWAHVENASIGWADIETAVVENFVAEEANIGNLAVQTHNIALGSIMQVEVDDWSPGLGSVPTSWTTVITRAVDNPSGGPIFFWVNTSTDLRNTKMEWRVMRVATQIGYNFRQSGATQALHTVYDSFCEGEPGSGSVTYTLDVKRTNTGTPANSNFNVRLTTANSLR